MVSLKNLKSVFDFKGDPTWYVVCVLYVPYNLSEIPNT